MIQERILLTILFVKLIYSFCHPICSIGCDERYLFHTIWPFVDVIRYFNTRSVGLSKWDLSNNACVQSRRYSLSNSQKHNQMISVFTINDLETLKLHPCSHIWLVSKSSSTWNTANIPSYPPYWLSPMCLRQEISQVIHYDWLWNSILLVLD